MLLCIILRCNADTLGRIKGAFCFFVCDQLYSTDQTLRAGIANERMVFKICHAFFKRWTNIAHVADNVSFFVDFQCLAANRCCKRMSCIGKAVAEYSQFFALLQHGFIHVIAHRNGAHGHIA